MTNRELRQQFELCQQWDDATQWDYLALEFFKAGFTLNAAECFRRADVVRDCSFAEAMPVEMVEAL